MSTQWLKNTYHLNGSDPNWIIIINKYSVVPFNLTNISQNFSEGKLMFSNQKRVKLIRSKLMTGSRSIDDFLRGWYFLEFLFKFKFASVKFSIFRLLFIEIYLKGNLFNVFGTKESKINSVKMNDGDMYY